MGLQTTIIIPPTTELHRKEIELRINQLRDFVGKNERWFNSKQEVIDYLNDIGVRSVFGKRVTATLLDVVFRKKLGFPYRTFGRRRNFVVTSNVLIMAWIWSLRVYKATRLNHPNTKDLANATAHLF